MSKSTKRRNSSSADDEPTPKKRRGSWMDRYEDADPEVGQEATVDPVYGQRGAFPGLDDADKELIYGDPEDGVQYLRLVRNEARDVPHILHARAPEDYTEAEQEAADKERGGYWEDGAYVAAAISHAPLEMVADGQDLYYQALMERFADLQLRLKKTPPFSAVQGLHSSTPISFPDNSTAARRQWRQTVDTKAPSPTQMACMDAKSILNLLQLLTNVLRQVAQDGDRKRIDRCAVWIWAALARCRDRGELRSEEVAVVRELGKAAVQFQRGQQVEMAGYEADFDVVGEELDFALQEARQILQLEGKEEKIEQEEIAGGNASTKDQAVVLPDEKEVLCRNKRARMGLDMVITIIGEVYGQRDLLEFRRIWDEEGE